MIHKIRVLPILWVAFFVFGFVAQGQNKGNIVEYFGKKKYEVTEEGAIIHHFEKGLVLEGAARGGVLFGSQDIIAWQIAQNTFVTPVEGDSIVNAYTGENPTLKWVAVEADTSGSFRGRNLRRGYLFTRFESPVEEVALLEATGHTRAYINGLAHEGDHYDFGYTLIPFKLKKGENHFVYTPGRFGYVKAKLVIPAKKVMFIKRDLTLPDLINGEQDEKWASIRLLNATNKDLKGLSIRCILENGEEAQFYTDAIMPMSVRKVKFKIPSARSSRTGKINATLVVSDHKGRELDRTTIVLEQRDAGVHHERTFISNIDGSVQYYSVAPSLTQSDGQALVLSVHGASVEARNQARAYKKKDWAHIVAPTNRRPFGFNWEEWGRIDAMEVLAEAKRVFKTDESKTYLTGHSMGGHGTWYLGVTYPGEFAAIAPCASYPDIIGYARQGGDATLESNPHFGQIKRAANAGRVLDLKRNFLQSGVYILHGSADNVVSVEQARMMRSVLGEFHNDFCYYEYPDGTHWYGDHSVDWFPIFDYFKWHSVPETKSVKHLEFHTASPAVSSENYWIRIEQQIKSWNFSKAVLDIKDDSIVGITENVSVVTLYLSKLELTGDPVVVLDGAALKVARGSDVTLKKEQSGWSQITTVDVNEKYSLRHGGFKQAFDNNMVFVYATGGSKVEDEWYCNKARFDAETFLYRGNGSVDVIADKEYSREKYKDRNVIIYGNASNNSAWKKVLRDAPIEVVNGAIHFGDRVFKGDDLGTCFIYPLAGSKTASVGVVAGTGIRGMKASFANNYFSGITGYPDIMIFSADFLKTGLDGIKISGFFGSDWSVENGDFSVEPSN